MKNLIKYLTEKLHLDSDIKISDTPTKKVDAPYIYPEAIDINKMNGYRAKGSKPERLIATIKDNGKLKRRFAAAVRLDWRDAVNKFGDALVNRGIYSREQVDAYIEKNKK